MKTKFLMLAILLSALVAKSQINQVGMISGVRDLRMIHLNNGYKFVTKFDSIIGQDQYGQNKYEQFLGLYNLSGIKEKIIEIPKMNWTDYSVEFVTYYLVSDHLFDNDNELELLMHFNGRQNSNNIQKDTSVVLLVNEAGVVLQTLSTFGNKYGVLNVSHFSDGISFSKLLIIDPIDNDVVIYDLPGYLPCESCSNTTTGSTKSLAPMVPSGMRVNVAPNPSAGEFTFHYQLPKGKNNAELIITNLNGAIVKTKKINNEIGSTPLLLNDLSSGIYIYTIQCEEERSTPQRIILTK